MRGEAGVLEVTRAGEGLHKLASREEQMLLRGVAGILVDQRAIVALGSREPLAQRRARSRAHQIAAHLDGAELVGQEDAQLRRARDEIQAVEDAVGLARGLE